MMHHLITRFLAALFAVMSLTSESAYSQTVKRGASDPAQPQINNLLSQIKPDTPDSVKAQNYMQIGSITNDIETKIKYALLSLDYCQASDTTRLLKNFNILYMAYYQKGEIRHSISYVQQAADLYLAKKDNITLSKCYSMLATMYGNLNMTDSATFYLNLNFEIGAALGDTAVISQYYKDMGIQLGNRMFVEEAENYIRKAIALDSLIHDTMNYAYGCMKLGELYLSNNQLLDAKKSLTKSINAYETLVFLQNPYQSYTYQIYKNHCYWVLSDLYIRLAYQDSNDVYADSCLYFYQKADPQNVSNYLLYRYTYVSYLMFYDINDEALKVLTDLKKTVHEKGTYEDHRKYHDFLKKVYTHLGDYRHALEHSEKEREIALSLYTDSAMNALADAKSSQAILIEKIERENAETLLLEKQRRKNIVIIALAGGLVLVLVVIVLVFRVLLIRKRANYILAEQKEEIAAQRDKIMAQRDHIEQQSKELQASIKYAQRIQRALLTPDDVISSVFPDYFLLYKPRNVVSGDFYWIGQFGDNKVCIVADCTGHGVPGGFMSVLGMTNLNYIVGQELSPDAILNKLRDAIIWNLRQNDADLNDFVLNAQVLDGMDVAAYVVNERQMTLSFAGANNPLLLIRDGIVQVIKPDKMPVGISMIMKPFKSTTINLRKGDCLYTYSDGFQDQFNTSCELKFQKSRLHDLLLEIHQRPMNEQRELLNLVFREWRGSAKNQTDDVVIMGVRI